jgi:hypothetical protein
METLIEDNVVKVLRGTIVKICGLSAQLEGSIYIQCSKDELNSLKFKLVEKPEKLIVE